MNLDFAVNSELLADGDDEEPEVSSLDQQDESKNNNCLVSWLVLFLMRLQSKYYRPDAAVSCLLKFMYALLLLLASRVK